MAHQSSQRPLPPMRSTLTPTKTPPLFFRYPWTLLDGVTRSWIGTWRWRGHGAADLREATKTEKRTNRPTRQDRRGRPRHQPDPRCRIHAVGSWPRTKKQANGHRRRRSPGDRLARAKNTWLLPQNPRGRSTTREGTRRRRAESPPLPCYPPGLSGSMGSPSPDAADTGAARRHPAGPARAATAQSTAAPAPAPAPRSRPPRPAWGW